ncbi:MAG TPA: cell division protein FtsZ [Thermodesulfovibrionales bacterium]|nr:cell division protein FtsZ [Thermodesulfovibrionales bacterium]
MFEIDDAKGQTAKIKVVGVGGAGGNAVNNMIASNLRGVEFIAVNTDTQVLETSLAPVKVQIGASITKGLGAGSNPEIGKQSALEDRPSIAEVLEGADMVFITAGMGGGTGTGASPVVAHVARELGALTVAIVTKPFFYEARTRAINAEEGIRELRNNVDTIIVIPNDRIALVVDKNTPLLKGFSIANDVLKQAVQGISDIILKPGLINVDFADVKTIMQNTGKAVMGTGTGKGEGGAAEAAKRAILNPLLEDSTIEGARGILFNITGGINLSLSDVQEAASIIYDSAHENATIIIGNVIDPDSDDEIRITVIATGFEEKREKVEMPQIKKWTPLSEPVSLKAAGRVLSKSLNPGIVLNTVSSDIMPYEDPLDVPTFMRKMPQREM